MSNPKEKAEELYWKYAEILYLLHDVRALKNSYAKKSASIAVDEIINTLNYDIRDLDVRGNILLDLIKFWREVKQEIEKL